MVRFAEEKDLDKVNELRKQVNDIRKRDGGEEQGRNALLFPLRFLYLANLK